jgi:peptidoglycan/LPS O-acetylase OafA/YrhL
VYFEEESDMSDRKLLAASALAGLGYGVLEIAGVIVGGASNPVPFDIVPSTATAARVAATPMPVGVWVGFGLEVVSTLLLIVFMVRATSAIRQADGQGLLATSALAAGIVNVAAVFVSFGFMAARNAATGAGLDAQSVKLVADLSWGTYFLSWPSMAMFLGCLGVGTIRTRALPAWLGWAGVLIAAAGLAGCLDPFNLGQLAQLLPIVWIPAAGIALAIRRTGAADSAAVMIPA